MMARVAPVSHRMIGKQQRLGTDGQFHQAGKKTENRNVGKLLGLEAKEFSADVDSGVKRRCGRIHGGTCQRL